MPLLPSRSSRRKQAPGPDGAPAPEGAGQGPAASGQGSGATAALPSAPSLSGVKGRRRPTLIALGVALIAVCALGAWWLVEQSSDANPVVVAAKEIPAGTVIDKGDVTTIEIEAPAGAKVIPGKKLSELVGQHATGPIQEGAIIPPGAITSKPVPEQGTVVVGILAKPGQMPAANVDPGDQVAIVGTPRDSDDPPAEAPQPTNGTVQSISQPYSDGSVVVDVVVAKEDAAALAALSATGRISIILTAGRL